MADITVVKTVIEKINYEIVLDSFTHGNTCPKWAKEIGKAVMVASVSNGFVPSKLFRVERRLNKVVSRPLVIPWKYCPYCGHQFTVTVTEA